MCAVKIKTCKIIESYNSFNKETPFYFATSANELGSSLLSSYDRQLHFSCKDEIPKAKKLDFFITVNILTYDRTYASKRHVKKIITLLNGTIVSRYRGKSFSFYRKGDSILDISTEARKNRPKKKIWALV